MRIEILPLTPERSDDYFDFFENRAFTDDSPYRCYCQGFQMTQQQEREAYANVPAENMGQAAREAARLQIAGGVLQGYLAYADGLCIGWCNANDRAGYPAASVTGGRFHAAWEAREKAVACFEIAPEFRGQGVATALIERVIADARAEGYCAVVGFPTVREKRYVWDFSGPVRLYEKEGFVKIPQADGSLMMRKEL